MPCYHPIKMYWSKALTVNGKRTLVPSSKDSTGSIAYIRCGQCIGCRLDKSREWAARISNEASLYERNCFITLTYSPENMPRHGSLELEHFQLFMKRLRKKYHDQPIRFFHCGEYGEQLRRPHYHACLLGFDFSDKRPYTKSSRGDVYYTSESLSQLWPYGFHQIGELNFASAAYCARYVTKKVTGNAQDFHYSTADVSTGELINLKPEYCTMSRRPGIGAPFLKKYQKDIYSHDQLVLRSGAKIPPPRYYDRQYEIINPEHFAQIQQNRLIKSSTDMTKKLVDTTEERLKVREVVHEATVKATLNRNLEKV